MKRNRPIINIIVGLIVCGLIVSGIIAVIFLLPEWVSEREDALILGHITIEEKADAAVWGYEYRLNADEKLFILSNALNNRVLPQSDFYAATRWLDSISTTQTQSYVFQQVTNENEYNPQTCEDALKRLEAELTLLSERSILPKINFNPDLSNYEVNLFSAIDILEPQKNVLVWQITYNGVMIRDGLVDCIMDAGTNKIYSVAVRANKTWPQYDADEIVKLWAEYIGSSVPEPYESDSPLLEDATYYQKYNVADADGNKTVVTVGYYEGVRELFVKIAR
jgi:hypothetical protein